MLNLPSELVFLFLGVSITFFLNLVYNHYLKEKIERWLSRRSLSVKNKTIEKLRKEIDHADDIINNIQAAIAENQSEIITYLFIGIGSLVFFILGAQISIDPIEDTETWADFFDFSDSSFSSFFSLPKKVFGTFFLTIGFLCFSVGLFAHETIVTRSYIINNYDDYIKVRKQRITELKGREYEPQETTEEINDYEQTENESPDKDKS